MIELGKSRAAAVMGLPMDLMELFGYGALTPSASLKARKTTPPTPELKGRRREQVMEPRIPLTSPDIYRRMGEDPESAEFLAGQMLGPELPVGKMATGGSALMALGAMKMPTRIQIKRADRLLKKGASEEDIFQKTGLVEADTASGWRKLPEKLPTRGYGGEKVMLPRKMRKQLVESPELGTLFQYMTPEELESLTPETIEAMETMARTGRTRPSAKYPEGKEITITHGKKAVPRLGQEELAAMAFAGRSKKGWYRHSAQQLSNVFEDDTERFIALLAAMSPQTSVEMNMENALRVWKNWDQAGRPTDKKAIKQIMGESVVGTGTEQSVMNAWVNNSLTALKATDPSKITLSGPKANSFMKNLLEGYDEVTLDTWMGRAENVIQDVFGGREGAKGPGYILSAAATRRAATFLEKRTGEKWTPAEVQETIWSFIKALYEKRKSGPGTATPMEKLSKELTQEEIAEVVDFASLMSDPKYSSILKGTKYEQRLQNITPFEPEAEIGDLPSYRGFEPTFGRVTKELEQQFRATDTGGILGKFRNRIHRGIVADRLGTGGVKRTFTRESQRNPGRSLKGLGKLDKLNLSPQDQGRLNSLGISTPDFYQLPNTPEAGLRFHDSITESKKINKFGAAVYVYDPEEYQGMKTFLTKDGMTGFAVKEDGDIVSVFNRIDSPYEKTTIPVLMLAVEEGGRKLDAFDTILPQLYSKVGFKVSSRTAWNDEYAPPGWDKTVYGDYNSGEPDVVFMHYDPESSDVYKMLQGNYDQADEARNAILVDDYDMAVGMQSDQVQKADAFFERGIIPFQTTEELTKQQQKLMREGAAMEALTGITSDVGFYSPAWKAVIDAKQDVLKAKHWISQLQGRGVPKEELEFTGVLQWLKSKGKEKVSKTELEEYLKANEIQIQEVISEGGEPFGSGDTMAEQFTRRSDWGERTFKYPGGTGYRELRLIAPPKAEASELGWDTWDIVQDEGGNWKIVWPDGTFSGGYGTRKAAEEAAEPRSKLVGKPLRGETFTEGHYPEENVILHVRFSERLDPEGNKVILIEEMQSDWGQMGKKQGFRDPETTKRREELLRRREEIDNRIRGKTSGELYDKYEKEFEEIKAIDKELRGMNFKSAENRIPAGPFVMDTNQWASLGLKRIIRWAADNDFKKIAWTTGKEQSERYGKTTTPRQIVYSHQHKELVFDQGADADLLAGVNKITDVEIDDLPSLLGDDVAEKLMTKEIELKTGGTAYMLKAVELDEVLMALTKEMEEINKLIDASKPEMRQMLKDEPLSRDWLGLRDFPKLFPDHPVSQAMRRKDEIHDELLTRDISRIEVAGKGMSKFYDKLLLNQAKSIGKKYNAEVKKGEFVSKRAGEVLTPHPEDIAQGVSPEKVRHISGPEVKEKVWTMDISPRLKRAAQQGLPYYAVLPPVYLGARAAQEEEYQAELPSRAAARAAYAQ